MSCLVLKQQEFPSTTLSFSLPVLLLDSTYLLSLLLPSSMLSNSFQLPSDSSLSSIIHPSPSSQKTSTLPSISGDPQNTIPVYQPNPLVANNPWIPYSQGFVLPQSIANSGPGEYVMCSPVIPPHQITSLSFRMLPPTMGHPWGAEI